MLTRSQKTGKIGRFSQNARLNGHARFKTGDFSTMISLTIHTCLNIKQPTQNILPPNFNVFKGSVTHLKKSLNMELYGQNRV